MHKADDPNYAINWNKPPSLNRTKLQEKEMGKVSIDEFDTTLYSPWMKRWEIIHCSAILCCETTELRNCTF